MPSWIWYVKSEDTPTVAVAVSYSLTTEAHSDVAPCPDGVTCCQVGDTCTPNGCCPSDQEQCGTSNCYNPSTSICCSDGSHCPMGDDCVGNGFCCPSGKILCGQDHCYDPNTQQCCGNQGACQLDLACCENECCTSDGHCGSDGYCQANTCTVTSTSTTTSYYTFTSTITELAESEEAEQAPEFTCPPISATNSASETLQLGTDCTLTLYPPPTDISTTSSSTGAGAPSVKPRATADGPNCLITSTSIVGYTIQTVTTTIMTVTETETPEGFSCPPMTVTNALGDELSLDQECQLEYSPGSLTPSSTSSASGAGAATSSGGGTKTSGVGKASPASEKVLWVFFVVIACTSFF